MSASKKSVLIPAVGYLRKSTKGERHDSNGNRRERQEKSLAQQREEVGKLTDGRFTVLKWFEDEGVSGWKRGGQRPDFQRMIAEVKALGAQAIVCDNIDRFSRAAFDEVQEDVNTLRRAGVRWIVTASHGEYDLGARFAIGDILKFVVSVWSACEYSRQLSRRIALSRRNAAIDGKWTGSTPAYGMAKDGTHALKPGDAKKVATVRWIFEQIGNQARSLNSVVGELNSDKEKFPPSGKQWYVRSVREMLNRRCYVGDFVYGRSRKGQFYSHDEKGEIKEVHELNGQPGKLFVKQGAYKPIIDRALFDKVQRRMARWKDRTQRKRVGYTLTGILVCDHCGKPMSGTRQKYVRSGHRKEYGPVIYRCPANHDHGKGSCGYHVAREDRLLPFILQALGAEMTTLEALVTAPPEVLYDPNRARDEKRQQAQADRDKLAAQIETAEENLLFATDPRTRQRFDAKVVVLRGRLDALDEELAEPVTEQHDTAELKEFLKWYRDFEQKAIRMPTRNRPIGNRGALLDDEETLLVDPRVVNDVLHQLGAEVRLRWETRKAKSARYGSIVTRHVLTRGRFRLGQKKGKLPRYVLETPAGREIRLHGRRHSCGQR